MSVTEIVVDATPEAVWAVLSDARTYEHWVVGCKEIRAVDADWPAPGASFHHAVGIGPITVKDSTSVLEAEPARRLKLRARARPAGVAHVILDLVAAGPGATRVTMTEYPTEGLPAKLHNPLQDRAIHHRNVEALRRLKKLAEDPARAGQVTADSDATVTLG